MKDYIEREAFLRSKRSLYCGNCDRRKNSKGKMVYEIGDAPCRACGLGDVLDDVEDFPAADVRPVVRGKWTQGDMPTYGGYKCSVCGGNTVHYKANFCPNCGSHNGGDENG